MFFSYGPAVQIPIDATQVERYDYIVFNATSNTLVLPAGWTAIAGAYYKSVVFSPYREFYAIVVEV
jgi:hypothetical protein